MSPSCKLHLRSCLQMYSRVNGNIHGTCKASRTRASPPFPFHSFSRFLLSFLCFPVVFENRTLYARRNDTATTSYRRQNGSRARDCHEFEFIRSGSRSSRGRGILSASSKILSLSRPLIPVKTFHMQIASAAGRISLPASPRRRAIGKYTFSVDM